MNKLVLLLALVVAGGIYADPVTYYVNAAMANDDGDGKSPATAKKYIQSAVDLCAAGDTVSVTNGVYKRAPESTTAAQVVYLSKKIYLTGSGDRDQTFIDGEGAVRGVVMADDTGSIVRGFTIQNCYNSTTGFGAGIRMDGGYAVDCVVSNCTSYYRGGGMGYGVALRCRIVNCRTGSAESKQYGTAAASTTMINCLIVGQTQNRQLFHNMQPTINCTIVGNAGSYGYRGSAYTVVNTIFTENGFSSFYAPSATPTT